MADLFCMSEQTVEVKRHVIFIHGLDGHYKNTWISANHNEDFWPNWLTQSLTDLDVWSISYEANISRWSKGHAMHFTDQAKNILERIMLEPSLSNGEIILVGHSLGGLVIKQMLRNAEQQLQDREDLYSFSQRVSKIVFLATPHLGSGLASAGDKLRVLIRPSVATSSLVRNDANLRALNNWYRSWSRNQKKHHLILMETKPYKVFGMIVKPDSADPGLSEETIPVEEDHESICKPESTTSQVYLQIKNFISKELVSPQFTWLKSHYGLSVNAWKGYDNWSNSPDGLANIYLIDDDVRIYSNSIENTEGLSSLDGINAIREKLKQASSSIRLTGLSGVGKTRILQALFDSQIGVNSLDKDLVFYSDIAASPTPLPIHLVEKLIETSTPAVVVIDNCPPDLHRKLNAISTVKDSSVSLITVEYDVREDQPEETDVFLLEPSSVGLIKRLIKNRYENISEVDSMSIAEFSGGNARIAIALANTVEKGESLAALTDENLFERLFLQRNSDNRILLKAAEACSLVYSFDNTVDGENGKELAVLATIAGISVNELYESVSELSRRGLVQKRSKWRAVLPHAIANRLAKRGLENYPVKMIESSFNHEGLERLLKSFSRRLSYLHESESAKEIADSWLSDEGLLDNITNLNELDFSILENIARIAPEKVLDKLINATDRDTSGDFFSRKNKKNQSYTDLLRLLAYESSLFPKAVKLLVGFALTEGKGERTNSIRSDLKSLFFIYLSGTHATAPQRLNVINFLMKSGDEIKIDLAFELLDAALEAWHFSSHHSFEFGSHSRNFGYSPKTQGEVHDWYRIFINYIIHELTNEVKTLASAKTLMAESFRGLWMKAGMHEELETAVDALSNNGSWNEGWLAIRQTLRFDSESMDYELLVRLKKLDKQIAPSSLEDKIEIFALDQNHNALEVVSDCDDDSPMDCYNKAEVMTQDLGAELIKDNELFNKLLPKFLAAPPTTGRLFSFGKGICVGADDPEDVWGVLVQELVVLALEYPSFDLLKGFIHQLVKSRPELANGLLDDAVINPILRSNFMQLQTITPIDAKALIRIKRSLELGYVPLWQYHALGYGHVIEAVSENDLIGILESIASKADGVFIAIDILQMYFLNKTDKHLELSHKLKVFGQRLLLRSEFSKENKTNGKYDYQLSRIIKFCFDRTDSFDVAMELSRKISIAILGGSLSVSDYSNLFKSLVTTQPMAFLEGFFTSDVEGSALFSFELISRFEDYANVLSQIDSIRVIEWCEIKPSIRYKLLANFIKPWSGLDENECYQWSELALVFIKNSPNKIEVLDGFFGSFKPSSWSGFRSDILISRLPLLIYLKESDDIKISRWATQKEEELREEIKFEMDREKLWSWTEDQAFE